jgi:hypothetical protein
MNVVPHLGLAHNSGETLSRSRSYKVIFFVNYDFIGANSVKMLRILNDSIMNYAQKVLRAKLWRQCHDKMLKLLTLVSQEVLFYKTFYICCLK